MRTKSFFFLKILFFYDSTYSLETSHHYNRFTLIDSSKDVCEKFYKESQDYLKDYSSKNITGNFFDAMSEKSLNFIIKKENISKKYKFNLFLLDARDIHSRKTLIQKIRTQWYLLSTTIFIQEDVFYQKRPSFESMKFKISQSRTENLGKNDSEKKFNLALKSVIKAFFDSSPEKFKKCYLEIYLDYNPTWGYQMLSIISQGHK